MIKLGSKLKILKTANKATALLPNGQISKVASAEDNSEYSNDFLYFIARALTANVPNANGDYFPEDELQKSYQSFIGKNLHLNHDADDVAKAVGKIIDAWFVKNDDDIYVVCLCKIDKKLHPELARNIETGIIDSVSMGCSCLECECSICGKKAHSEAEMCDHLKNYLGREININGKNEKVSSINRGITFNELSLVGDPADNQAHMYQIYASKKQGDNMNKKAMQDGKTEDVIQDEVKKEIEKTIEQKVEDKKEEKTETETKAEVKEEIKQVEEKLDEVKDIVEEKKEELKDLKEDVKDIKEETKEEVKEEVKEEKKETEEKVEKEESCKKKAREEWEWATYKITLKADDGLFSIYINAPSEESAINSVLKSEGAPRSAIKKVKELSEEEAKELYSSTKKNVVKKAETEEEIKDIEEIKEKAEEAVKEDKEKEEEKTETTEDKKEEIVEETKEEEKKDGKAETLEEVKDKVEDIKEEIVAEIGDLFTPVKDPTKEFKITDIYEDNGEKFLETEVEGKKKVYALKNVKVKKQAEAPAKPTTAPSAGMKWVFNKNTNAWEQKPENTKTVEVEAETVKKIFIAKKDNDIVYSEDIEKVKPYIEKGYKLIESKETALDDYINAGVNVKKAEKEYKYTLINAGKQPRWLITDKATNKIAQKLFLSDLPKEAQNFNYKTIIAKAVAEVGVEKVASKLGVNKKAIKVNDKYTLILEGQEPKTLVIENIYINEDAKETFIKTKIDGSDTDDNIFSESKFLKMIEDGAITKAEVVEEVQEEVVEETAENKVEMTEDTVSMNQDETSAPMNDLQSSNKTNVEKKASFWEVKKDEVTGKYYLESPKGKYQDAEGHTYKFNSREDALEEIDFLDAEHKYKKEMKNKKEAAAGDGELMAQQDVTPDFKLQPEVKPNEANTLANGESASPAGVIPSTEEELTAKQKLQVKINELAQAVETVEDDKLGFIEKEIQDAIDYVAGKPIEEIENDEEEIMEFSNITWDSDNKDLPAVANVVVDDINWNNINARKDGAMILASIYNAKPISYKVASKKINKMEKTASKINKVAFVNILKQEIANANQEIQTMKITAQIKEKKELCSGIVKQAMAKGLVHIDAEEIKKNLLKGMGAVEAREAAVRKAADEQVKNLMAMDKASITAYKETVANFVMPTYKTKAQSIGRITASADYDEDFTKNLPWSRRK